MTDALLEAWLHGPKAGLDTPRWTWQEVELVCRESSNENLFYALEWAHAHFVLCPREHLQRTDTISKLLDNALQPHQPAQVWKEAVLYWTCLYPELSHLPSLANLNQRIHLHCRSNTSSFGLQTAYIKFLQLLLALHYNAPIPGFDTTAKKSWSDVVQFIRQSNESSDSFVGLVTAYINILLPLCSTRKEYLTETLSLLKEMCRTKRTVRSAFDDRVIKKACKNSLCAILKSHEKLSESESFEIVDILTQVFDAKADLHHFSSILASRGIKYIPPQSKRKARPLPAAQPKVTYIYSPQQHNDAFLHALYQQASRIPHIPPVILPPGFQMSVVPLPLIADMIIESTRVFGSLHPDGGVADWQQTISLLQSSAEQYLSAQIPFQTITEKQDDQEPTVVEKESDAPAQPWIQKKTPVIKEREPYSLRAATLPDRDESVQMIWECFERLFAAWLRRSGSEEDEELDDEIMQSAHTVVGDEVERLVKELDGGVKWIQDVLSSGPLWVEREEETLYGRRKRVKLSDDHEERQGDDDVGDGELEEKVKEENEVREPLWSLKLALERLKASYKGSRAFWSVFSARLIYHVADTFVLGTEADDGEAQEEQKSLRILGYRLKKEFLIPFIVDDFAAKWDLAVRWLWEEYYHDTNDSNTMESDDRIVSGFSYWLAHLLGNMIQTARDAAPGDPVYTPWLTQNGQNTLFRRFLEALPDIPVFLFQAESITVCPPSFAKVDLEEIEPAKPGLLLQLCDITLNSPVPSPLQRVQLKLGLDVLYDLLTYRPACRKHGLFDLMMTYCASSEEPRRLEAIRAIRRWWSVSGRSHLEKESDSKLEGITDEMEETFALLTDPQRDLRSAAGYVNGIHERLTQRTFSNCLSRLESLMQPGEWSKDRVLAIISTYLVCCLPNLSLMKDLICLFGHVNEESRSEIQAVVVTLVGKMARFIGMPSQENSNAMALLTCFESSPKDSEQILLEWFSIITGVLQPADEGKFTPGTEAMSRFLFERLDQFEQNASFLCMLVYGHGLSQRERQRVVILLADRLLGVEGGEPDIEEQREQQKTMFRNTIAKLLMSTGKDMLSAQDLIILFHTLEIAPGTSMTLQFRKQIEAIQLFLSSPSLSSYFTPRSLSSAFQNLLDAQGSRILPLFMRSLLIALVHLGDAFKPYVAGGPNSVLGRVMTFKSLWNGARNSGGTDDELKRAKALWEGWTRCMQKCAPQSFGLLVDISKTYMSLVLNKLDREFSVDFEKWVKSRAIAIGVPRSKLKRALTVLDRLKSGETAVVEDTVE